METSAMPSLDFLSDPAKITSSLFLLRTAFMLCSPKTQRMASEKFDFPLPFGPTTEMIPGSNSKTVFLAKDLKPCISIFFRYIKSAEEKALNVFCFCFSQPHVKLRRLTDKDASARAFYALIVYQIFPP